MCRLFRDSNKREFQRFLEKEKYKQSTLINVPLKLYRLLEFSNMLVCIMKASGVCYISRFLLISPDLFSTNPGSYWIESTIRERNLLFIQISTQILFRHLKCSLIFFSACFFSTVKRLSWGCDSSLWTKLSGVTSALTSFKLLLQDTLYLNLTIRDSRELLA